MHPVKKVGLYKMAFMMLPAKAIFLLAAALCLQRSESDAASGRAAIRAVLQKGELNYVRAGQLSYASITESRETQRLLGRIRRTPG